MKKQYRKKSLLIHPDKFKHENGMEVSSLRLSRLQSLNNTPLRRHLTI